MARYGAYTRVSRVGNRGDRLLSPTFQTQQIEQWAKANGHELVKLEPELDASGGRDDRPILTAAIEEVEAGTLDGIAVARLDRFSRSMRGALGLLDRIESAGGRVASVAEQIDSSTAVGRKTRNDFLNMAEFERETKREGLALARGDAVRRGIHVAGKTPFGYRRRDDRILEPDPETAPIMREMFERRAAGESWRQIAKQVAASLGRPYAPQSIQRMVTNRVYLGEARNGEFVNAEAHEPLIDRATFAAAQLGHPRPPRGKLGPALLSGVLYCAGCGHRMIPTSRGGVRAYRCTRIHAAGECPAPAHVGKWAETYISERVKALMSDRAYRASRSTGGLHAAEQALEAAEQARDDFAAATAGMAREDIAAGMQAHADAVREARRNLAEQRAAGGPLPDVASFAEHWDSLSVEKRRHVLALGLGGVVVRKGSGPDPDRLRLLEPGASVPLDRPVDFDRLEGVIGGS